MTTDGVFHPGHDELHGQTVVVYTSGPRTFVGRWHEAREDAVLMKDVCVHEDGASDTSRDEWVAQKKTYGIPVEHPSALVPRAEVTRVVRLREA